MRDREGLNILRSRGKRDTWRLSATLSIAATGSQGDRKKSAASVCNRRKARSPVGGRISFGAEDFLITSSHVRIR